MGNKSCCFAHKTPPPIRKPHLDGGPMRDSLTDWKHNSHANLPHISEREPENFDANPSIHAKAGTLFMERSKVSENGMVRKKSLSHVSVPQNAVKNMTNPKHLKKNFLKLLKHILNVCRLKKSNSCSTIYLDDSTVSQPNLKNTIKCVALAIYYNIKNRSSNRQLDIFDEKLHPLTKDPVPDTYDQHIPEHRQIYKCIRTLFGAAQLTAECAIITLVYLERLLTLAEIDITPGNWKRIVLGAILLASKVWDDQAVWNVDYCQILIDVSVEDMNELERQFLEMIQFNINVPSSVYAKYYFDLRTLAEDNDLAFPGEPLSKERAEKLEAMSRKYQDKIVLNALKNSKKWSSLDNVSMGQPRRSIAILS